MLRIFAQESKFESAAYIPVRKNENITSILLICARKQTLSAGTIQPYTGLADLISTAFERTFEIQQTEKHLREVETLASIGEIISVSSDLRGFFDALHSIVRQIIGDYSFMVALYDEKSDTISIPYSQELGQFLSIDPFPLGEGLTSILLRTRQPLMLVEDTEKQAAELGAKIQPADLANHFGAEIFFGRGHRRARLGMRGVTTRIAGNRIIQPVADSGEMLSLEFRNLRSRIIAN